MRAHLCRFAITVFFSLALSAVLDLALPVSSDAFASEARYRQFVKKFWGTARKAGISRSVYDKAFEGLTPDPEVIRKDAHQPEFTLTSAYYHVLTVTDTRIATGREMLKKYKDVLKKIEKKYGVDRHVLLAVWGMETNFGTFMGGHDIIRALSTLAYTGRRQKFGRIQLLAALKIMQRGYATRDELTGSWAGAVGYTQLIPTNYLKYAVDFDGDGRRDLWKSPADALASTANYLARAKWIRGRTWGYEVAVPKKISTRLSGRRNARSIKRWMALGVKRVNDQQFPRSGDRAYLYFPDGRTGPVFLLLDNFRVIMRYNASHKYAMSVAHLSDRFRGMGPFVTPWRDGVRALTESERLDIQNLLIARGHEIGKADGVLGSKTRAAIRVVQKENRLKPQDGFPTPKILEFLRSTAKAEN